MEVMTLHQIKIAHPDQWVLIGNPELDNDTTLGSIVSKLLRGVVLLAGKDKREIAYKAKDVKGGYNRTAFIYTGEIPQNRRYLL
jgi:hypothetical protein